MIRLVCAGHVPAGLTPHDLGVILVLHAHPLTQRRVLEGRDVPRRIDVRIPRPELLIDDDSIVERESRLLGEADVRFDADPRDNAVDLDRPFAAIFSARRDNEPAIALFDARGAAPRAQRYTLFAVVLVCRAGKSRRVDVLADGNAGKDHHDLSAVHGERRRDLRPDEAGADDCEPMTGACQIPEVHVIIERSVVDHFTGAVAFEFQRAWGATRRQQQLLIRVLSTLIVHRPLVLEIKGRDSAPEMRVDSVFRRLEPDFLERLALPEVFRKRRPLVRAVRLTAHDRDCPFRVHLADALDSRVAGHARAGDQVLIGRHRLALRG